MFKNDFQQRPTLLLRFQKMCGSPGLTLLQHAGGWEIASCVLGVNPQHTRPKKFHCKNVFPALVAVATEKRSIPGNHGDSVCSGL